MALDQGDNVMMVLDSESNESRYFSRQLMCPVTGISYNEPAPHTFSFNSPQGACPHCNGLGEVSSIDEKKLIPDRELSIRKGGIEPLGKYRNVWIFWQIESIAEKNGFTLDTPIKDIPEEALNKILYGSDEVLRLSNTPLGMTSKLSSYIRRGCKFHRKPRISGCQEERIKDEGPSIFSMTFVSGM